jgi:SAM-dependent methyltransferase
LECSPYNNDQIYITEQVTAFYRYLSARFQNVTGSEFVGEYCAPGSVTPEGIRHEDLTDLNFPAGFFKNLLSFDCLEHIPDDTKALTECYRVLSPSANMLFSVPFDLSSKRNITRAKLTEKGKIEHILEPEYHGDPMKKSGCLCFRHYGWELLDALKKVGFKDAYAILYWSRDFCYLGGEQVILVAKK